ncbi:MAG: GGDEF domain-containing protein [Minwuia sp.]|uniref:GGDEF domain-containing protein n=1 Tax=Minwuia sp. TaxID=2493630 RepID=UPI003A8A5110
MSLAISSETALNPALARLTSEISRRFYSPDASYDGERLMLLEKVLDFAIHAEQQLAEQKERIAHLETMTRTDELTGLLNRRGLECMLGRLIASASRHGETGVICYVDIDDFKGVNDRHGHAAGDEALKLIASILSDNTRADDIAARIGGDEFVIVLTSTNIRDGLRKAKKLQAQLNSSRVEFGGASVPLSVSFGIQAYDGKTSVNDVLARADKAMYAQKRDRKTQLVAIATG